jgi:hypothetical protein
MDLDDLTEHLHAYVKTRDWDGAARLVSRQIEKSRTADERWGIGTAIVRAMNPNRHYTSERPVITRHAADDSSWSKVTDAMTKAYRKRDCHRVPTAVVTGLCHVAHYLRDPETRWSKNTAINAVNAVHDWLNAHE